MFKKRFTLKHNSHKANHTVLQFEITNIQTKFSSNNDIVGHTITHSHTFAAACTDISKIAGIAARINLTFHHSSSFYLFSNGMPIQVTSDAYGCLIFYIVSVFSITISHLTQRFFA